MKLNEKTIKRITIRYVDGAEERLFLTDDMYEHLIDHISEMCDNDIFTTHLWITYKKDIDGHDYEIWLNLNNVSCIKENDY